MKIFSAPFSARSFSLLAGALIFLLYFAPPLVQAQTVAQTAARTDASRGIEEEDEHVVSPGETLNGISARLLHEGETRRVQRMLAEHNRLSDADRISPGQVLRIPRAWLKARPATLEVVAVQGETNSRGQPLAAGARLAAGDDVRTGRDGYVILKLADGSTLSLMPSAEARVERANASPGAGTTDTSVRLDRGRAETAVQRPAKGGTRFEIRTPVAVAAVRGTKFRVAVLDSAGERSTSEVIEGAVGVSDANERASVAVAAGFGTRVTAGEAPLAPRALLPAPALWTGVRMVSSASANLEFSPLRGALSYRVRVSPREDFNPTLSEEIAPTAQVRIAALADGDYFVRVRGIDDISLEGRDTVARLRVRTLAEPPRPSNPPERSRIYGGTVEFAWLADPGATRYALEIARDPAFRTLAGQWAELREPRHVAENLAPGEYYWRIASTQADGRASLHSEPRSFSLRPAPLPMHAPKIEEETIALSWPARPGQRFEWQMAADAGFTRIVAGQATGEAGAVIPRPAQGTYHLRMRATDPDGSVGPFTPVIVLEVPARAPKPACLVEGIGGVCAIFAPQPTAPR
jgi:hypothetical protein